MSELAIEYGWLVERVGYHTCGAGESGYYGHHEPGCGSWPVAELRTLPGYDEWVNKIRAEERERVAGLIDECWNGSQMSEWQFSNALPDWRMGMSDAAHIVRKAQP